MRVNGFQDRRIQPLCHLSGSRIVSAGRHRRNGAALGTNVAPRRHRAACAARLDARPCAIGGFHVVTLPIGARFARRGSALSRAVERSAARRSGYGTTRPAGAESANSGNDSAPSVADPGELAFEQHRWQDAINEYRKLLAASPEDRLSLLRIAQAQRELRKYNDALATLEQARTANAPEAMVDLERARNLALLGRKDDALDALDASDHSGLRALELVETAHEFDSFRGSSRFERVHRNIRARVFPCEAEPNARTSTSGSAAGKCASPTARSSARTRSRRATAVARFASTTTARAVPRHEPTFYLPSRGEWRQVWTGSGGTLFDLTGKLVDGSMKMEGQVEYVEGNRVVAFRGTWTQAADGRVGSDSRSSISVRRLGSSGSTASSAGSTGRRTSP